MTDIATLLRRAGPLLYGELWQHDLARALSVSSRSVQRWASGESVPPPGIRAEIAAIAARRADELTEFIAEIRGENDQSL